MDLGSNLKAELIAEFNQHFSLSNYDQKNTPN